MSSRPLKVLISVAAVAAFAAVPATSWAQDDPASGEYTESAPNFQPNEPEPQPEPQPAPTPAPAPTPSASAPSSSATPSSTPATPVAEQLPRTGADPRLGLAAIALLSVGFGLRRSIRAN